MQKDFDGWNEKKKTLHAEQARPLYHEREVWWCSLGVNIGYEQDGTGVNFDRPVLVIRGFNKETCLAVALTGKRREGKYYFYVGEIEGREATAILSQLRIVDAKRLVRKIGTVPKETFAEIKVALAGVLLGLHPVGEDAGQGENSLPALARGRGRSPM